MNVVIVEDEKYTADLIVRLVKKYDSSCKIVSVFSTVSETVSWFINQTEQVDLILMDIQLSDGSSFEIFERVSIKIPIIFITAFDEYAIKAFKVNSIDYLLKPIDYNDIEKAFNKYLQLQEAYKVVDNQILSAIVKEKSKTYKRRFLIKVGEQFKFINSDEISYFLFEEGVVFAQLFSNQRILIDESLDVLSELLDPDLFFRANRKIIASIKSINTIHSYFNRRMSVHLKPDDRQIIISRERVNNFKDWLNN